MADEQDPKQAKPNTKPHPFDGHTLMWIAWAFFVYYIFIDLNQTKSILIPYSQFKQEIIEKKVESVTFKLDEIHGKYLGTTADKTNSFKTIIPAIPDADLLPLLENNNITVVALSQADPKWLQVLLGILPWLLIMAFFIYSSRMLQNRMGGGRGGLFGFSKSNARLFEGSDNQLGYDDVAGVEGAKQDLQEIIDFLKQPEKFRSVGAKMPRGIL